MSNKEFKKSYMHPTRRKLVDMVHNGKYEKNPTISMANADKKKESEHKVGDVWTDHRGVTWEQKAGYRVKHSKLSDTMLEVRKFLNKLDRCKSKECPKKGEYARFSHTDKKLIRKSGYCSACLARLEHPIRLDGLYVAYENFKILSNMLKEGELLLENLQEAYDAAKQQYEYVDADGKTQVWKMDRPVEELKEEIQQDIDNVKGEVELVNQKRDEVYLMLKDKNYELVEDYEPMTTKEQQIANMEMEQ